MNFTRTKRNHEHGFVTISNAAAKDKRLSLKAKGFLLTIMSLPPDWDFSINGMAAIMPEGKKAIYAVIKELMDAGYCKRERVYTNGKISSWDYNFDEQPSHLNLLPQNLQVENLQVENLFVEKEPQYNKQLIQETKNTKQSDNDTNVSDCYVSETVSEAWCVIQTRKGILPTTAVKQLGRLTKEFGAATVNAAFVQSEDRLRTASDAQAYFTATLKNLKTEKPPQKRTTYQNGKPVFEADDSRNPLSGKFVY